MSVYVAGHKGLIGSNLVRLGAKEYTPPIFSTFAEYKSNDAIINCIGLTDVDACERIPRQSYESNVETVSELIQDIEHFPAPHLTHISTDFIFNGERGYYSEDDVPSPLSVYGAQKWIADTLVSTHPRHLIVRTTCVFGWHPKKYTFAHWVKDMCARGEPFGVTSEQVTTPTYAPDLARIILELVERRVTGIVNVTSDKLMSRYSFARDLAEAFGYDRNMILKVGNIMQVARRPALGGLCCLKLEGMGITPQPLELSLKEMATTWGK